MVESLTPEREFGGFNTYLRRVVSLSKDTFTSRKVLVIPKEAVALSGHDRKIVDWDIKRQHKQNFY